MSQGTPDYLIPRMSNLPVSSTRYYQTASITRMQAPQVETVQVTGPLPPPRPGTVSAGLPAEGVLLTHEQSWIIAGTALGPLLRSVCLAPGEITQIAVSNHSRSVVQNSVDSGIQAEDIGQQVDSSGTMDEKEKATAKDSASGLGNATASSMSSQGGVGGLLGGFGVSAGSGTNLASSQQAGVSVGNRQVSDEANQSVHQAAREQARLARGRHTASIREVSESDSLELDTRVLANYNHMHALTMQYYEVDQVYRLRTRVTRAERLLFVPMRLIEFGRPKEADRAFARYLAPLIDTARDLGLDHVVAKLSARRLGEASLQERIEKAEAQINALTAVLKTADETVAQMKADSEQAEDKVLAARDALRKASERTGLAERVKLQRSLAAASSQEKDAAQGLANAVSVAQQVRLDLDAAQQAKVQGTDASELDDAELRAEMDKYRLAFNQGLWLRLDPSVTTGFLHNRVFRGSRLGETIDPNPVAVSGNYLGFRWQFSDHDEAARFESRYVGAAELENSVALPTGGLWGEAVLGESNSAEKIDLTRFWNWRDALPPIRPAEIDALGIEEEPPLVTPAKAEVQESQVKPGPIVFPQVASGISSITAALANPELFRDMSSQATTAALAQSALELSKDGASVAGKLASENYKRFLSFQKAAASALLDVAAKAQEKGTVDPTLAGGILNAKNGGDSRSDATPRENSGNAGTGEKGEASKEEKPEFDVVFEQDENASHTP